MIHGKHNLKFGGELRMLTLYNDQLGGTTYSFANVAAFLANSPSSIAFNGDLSAKSPFTGLSGQAHLRQNLYIFYAQDEWKMLPTLTMSYGLRYEYYQPLHDVNNKAVIFDIAKGDIVAGSSAPWYKSSKKNFGPRLAFSWSPERFKNKTVFRIGGGYYYGPGQTEDQLQPSANDRISRTISSGPQLAYPFDVSTIYQTYNINDPNLGYQPRAYGAGYRIPERILSYTASVQQSLPGNAVLTVAYVGSQGRNLFLRSVTNKIIGVTMNPTTGAGSAVREFGNRFAEIDYKTSGGTDNYNSMQITLNRRYASGLSLGAQYGWAHGIGDSGGSNEANTAGNPFNFAADRGSNNFDIRQSFNMTALYDLPVGKGKKFMKDAPTRNGPAARRLATGRHRERPHRRADRRTDHAPRHRLSRYARWQHLRQPGSGQRHGGHGAGGQHAGRRQQPQRAASGCGGRRGPVLEERAELAESGGVFDSGGRDLRQLGAQRLSGPGLQQFDITLEQEVPRGGGQERGVPLGVLQHLQPRELRQPRESAAGGGPADRAGSPGIQPGVAFSPSTAGGNFGVLTSTVSNQIGIGTNRQIQLSLRLNF